MKEIKYLIVGGGLAGACFALECLSRGLSFVLIDKKEGLKTSKIAAGIFNPLILKHFTLSWEVERFCLKMHETYREFESLLNKKYIYPLLTYHLFKDEYEKKTWIKKSKNLKNFLGSANLQNLYSFIRAPFDLGATHQSAKLEVRALLNDFREFLKTKNQFLEEEFLYKNLNFSQQKEIYYKNLKAKSLVFCQGAELSQNPFFDKIPLIPNKGELLSIRLPKKYQIKEMIHSRVFLLPQNKQENTYFVGATYQRDPSKSLIENTTKEAKTELLEKLTSFLLCPFEILSQEAGIRPTLADRRPLVGMHPTYKSVALLNGLGSRGVLLAPNMAKFLIGHMEKGKKIPPEVDINRFF